MHARDHWQLNPRIDFLNHGSFGACPKIVLQKQHDLIRSLEQDPIAYLAPERDLEPKLDEVRNKIATLVNASATDIAFVRNATDGVNAVLSSIPLQPGEEILITNHGYNACNNAAQFAAQRTGARVTMANVPFPLTTQQAVLDALDSQISPQTRLILVDHVTSPTGLIFPVEEITSMAHARNICVFVDGAHAPGMIQLDLSRMKPDFYTGNHHKWLCGPKTSGFLYVQPELQHQVRPNVISHSANRPRPKRSRFISEFDWTGTYDPSPLLAVPAALDFMRNLYPGGLVELLETNRQKALLARRILCDALAMEPPSPDCMIGSLVTIPINADQFCRRGETGTPTETLQKTLRCDHQFELPVFAFEGKDPHCLRVSMQAYNETSQVERLARILLSLKR